MNVLTHNRNTRFPKGCSIEMGLGRPRHTFWEKACTKWMPKNWKQPRPKRRWPDEIDAYWENWIIIALDHEQWKEGMECSQLLLMIIINVLGNYFSCLQYIKITLLCNIIIFQYATTYLTMFSMITT